VISQARRPVALVVCIALAVLADSTRATQRSKVENASHTLPDGERILELGSVVPGALDEVWAAFTTSDGFGSWAAPVAEVDFRLGGVIESSYDLDAKIGDPGNIRNEILAYVPHRMIAFRNIQAPPGARFDVTTFQRLHTVVLFENAGANATKVTIVQPGYRPGDLYDSVYRHFEWGNRWSLEKLAERFEKGPIAWTSGPVEPQEDSAMWLPTTVPPAPLTRWRPGS
jgi:uncharacterized protein YndB with AHSA1/START domain